jgi:hypothetical protein
VLCRLAAAGGLEYAYVEQVLIFVETDGWEARYVSALRARYFEG